LFDANYPARATDPFAKQAKAQTGPAAYVQNGIARVQAKARDGEATDRLEQGQFQVIDRRTPPVLRESGFAVRATVLVAGLGQGMSAWWRRCCGCGCWREHGTAAMPLRSFSQTA
jgi:hypothetical protein